MDVLLTKEVIGEEEEADLAEWLVADGGAVTEGQVIAQFETAKLLADLKAPGAGTLTHTVSEGDLVNLGDVVATIS